MRTSFKRSYSELRGIETLEERFAYLRLNGVVSEPTFGSNRRINQLFYQSRDWRDARREVIIRDNNCDLGMEGYDVHESIYVHHMNPMSVDDIVNGNRDIFNPEFLVSVTLGTHNAIHYGDESQLPRIFNERRPNDHILW